MNPLAQKIRDLGGQVLSEPLTLPNGEINPACADQLFSVLESPDPEAWAALEAVGNGCTIAGPSRGDCEHFIGYPSPIHRPHLHDGSDDTVDVYGKPNGWCWSCWKSYRIDQLEKQIRALKKSSS